MVSIQTTAHVGADGRLDVQMPAEYRETNVKITLLVEPAEASSHDTQEKRDASGWPVGFFENTAGAWQGEPRKRGEQGHYALTGEPLNAELAAELKQWQALGASAWNMFSYAEGNRE